jgi:hypothetical protein
MTLFMQRTLKIPPLHAGMVFVPAALAFIVAARGSAVRARHRGTLVLIEGCTIQMTGLAALALTSAAIESPTALLLALVTTIFGFGQGMVMAPLSGAVLSTVKPASAGSGAGMYGTAVQIASAVGVATVGAIFFAVESSGNAQHALFASLSVFALSIVISVAFLTWMRRATV